MFRRFRPVLLASAAYLVLTAIVTWPLPLHLGGLIPNDLGDALLNMWLLDWNARTVPLTTEWWNAPQFFPVPGVMAFSEHLLGLSLLTTPVIWATGNNLLAYNLAFVLSFPLCALSAYALTYTIARRHDAAFVSGLAFAFAPYRMAQFAHVQVLSSYWMPLALAGLHRYVDDRRARWLILFAGAWLMQALACGYYLIYLSVLVAFWLMWFPFGRERWAALTRVGLAWAAALLLISPILYGYWKFQHAYGFSRGIFEIKLFSADVASLLKAPDNLLIWGWLNVFDRAEAALFPGVAVVVLTATALAIGWRSASHERVGRRPVARVLIVLTVVFTGIAISPALVGPWKIEIGGLRLLSVAQSHKPLSLAVLCAALACVLHPAIRIAWRRRSVLAFYALGAVLMWLLSLGPEPTLLNTPILYKAPYAWLMQMPGVEGVRVPARFWMLAVLCLAVTGGLAAGDLADRFPSRARAILAAGSLALFLEGLPAQIALVAPPPSLPSRVDARARLDLPTDVSQDLITLYRAIEHRRALINGYSGYFARHYWVLQYLIDHRDPIVLRWLAGLGPIEVVVDHRLDREETWRRWVAAYPGSERAYADEAETVFRLPAAAPLVASRPAGQPLPVSSIAAPGKAAPVAAMTDNDALSRWHLGRPQQPGDSMTIDLGQMRTVAGVELLVGGYVADFPRQLRIETSSDGASWSEAWSGGGGAATLLGALEDPLAAALTFAFEPREARYVRLTQAGSDPTYYWSVAELRIYGN